MPSNILVLGAGFSFDSGIPLLRDFTQTILDLGDRRAHKGKALDAETMSALLDAASIRAELDQYHGRAAFDDLNVEDILSILLFDVLGQRTEGDSKLERFARAIARTIEVTCDVTHPGLVGGDRFEAVSTGSDLYRRFWQALFKWVEHGHEMPTIVTFNYDLVLERSLLQTLVNTNYDSYKKRLPFDYVSLRYLFPLVPDLLYQIKYVTYGFEERKSGTALQLVPSGAPTKCAQIDLLKLHGSLNFPTTASEKPMEDKFNIASCLSKPFLVPPVFNKGPSDFASQMWAIGRDRFRQARNVVFVGYSFPTTDTYLRYFLKSAFGPNGELRTVHVFDPVLFSGSGDAKQMMDRYLQCFAQQMHRRIDFRPATDIGGVNSERDGGTLAHFILALERQPESILFA